MSIASSAAMKTRNALTASQIEFEANRIDEYLQRATDKHTQLGAQLSKYEGYLSMCEGQLPGLFTDITSIMSSVSLQPQSEQNNGLNNRLSLLKQRYVQLRQSYVQLLPKVAFLQTEVERAHREEQQLLKQKTALETRKKLADSGYEAAQKMEDNAIKRMAFNA